MRQIPLLFIFGAAFLLFNCAAPKSASEQQRRKPHPDAIGNERLKEYKHKFSIEDSVWELPPVKHQEFFNSYPNCRGLSITAAPKTWVELPCRRTVQGLPVKTLVHTGSPLFRLKIFDLPGGLSGINTSQTDSLLGYLFKIEPFGPPRQTTQWHEQLFRSTLDGKNHWALKLFSDSCLTLLFLESPETSVDSSFPFPSLHWTFSGTGTPCPGLKTADLFKAALLNTMGLLAVQDSSYGQALEWFKQAYRLDSAYIPHLINISAMYQAMNETPAAIQFLEQHQTLLRSSSELSGLIGAYYEERKQYRAAKDWAERALLLDPENEEWLINLSDALWQLGEKVKSKNILLPLFRKTGSFRLSVYLANTHLGLEEYRQACDILESAHRSHSPDDKSIEYMLMSLNGLKKYSAALNFYCAHADEFPTSGMLLQKATAEFNLKFYQLSERSLQKAMRLDPANNDAENLLTRVQVILGNKTNFILKKDIPPLPINLTSNQIKVFSKLALEAFPPKNHSVVTVARKSIFSWSPGKKWKKTTRFIYHIRNSAALVDLLEFKFELNPNYSGIHVNHFRLLDDNFKVITEEKAESFYVSQIYDTWVHPENLMVHLPVKTGTKPVYIDILVTEASTKPMEELPYLNYLFQSAYPIFHNTFDILDPQPAMSLHSFGEVEIDSSLGKLTLRFPPGGYSGKEKFSPVFEEYGSGFSAAPLKTWMQVGTEYFDYLENAGIRPDSVPYPVRELAYEIMGPGPGNNDPVKACFSYVRDAVSYTNLEFSLHALIPEGSEDTHYKRKGDCKGHSLLLIHLLRSLNIPANLCLVSLGHSGQADQPTLHQFNHMIVHVPSAAGADYFLDPTEKYQAFRRVPLSLQGKNAFILEKGHHRITSIPDIQIDEENSARIIHHIKGGPDKTLVGADTLTITGKLAADFREQIGKWDPDKKNETILSWMAENHPGFLSGDLKILDELLMNEPLRFILSFQGTTSENRLLIEPEIVKSLLRSPPAGRTSPIYFPFQTVIRSEWRFANGSGLVFSTSLKPETNRQHHLTRQIETSPADSATLRITHQWNLAPFLADPEEYDRIKPAWDNMLEKSAFQVDIAEGK